MTIPMPDPAAYFYQWEMDKRKSPYPMGIPVLTYSEAEAYADARVREVLEDLVDTLETRQFGGQDQIVSVIRNLIPPLPGPVEPTT